MTLAVLPGALVAGCACKERASVVTTVPGFEGRCSATQEQTSKRLAAVRKRLGSLIEAPGTSSAAARVKDQAGILDPAVATRIEQDLAAYHTETCHQLGLVTVKSLHGEHIDDYSLALANELRLGYAGLNNGVLLLIAPNERSTRIEVGCGLEDVIGDAAAQAILRDVMIPAFRRGAYADGARAGLQALMELARAKSIPAAYRPAVCSRPPS